MAKKLLGFLMLLFSAYYYYMRFDIILRITNQGKINSDIIELILPIVTSIVGLYLILKRRIIK